MSELEEKKPVGRTPKPPIDKHVDTVKVKNNFHGAIDMKHQKLSPGQIGLATIAEQEALHMYLEVIP